LCWLKQDCTFVLYVSAAVLPCFAIAAQETILSTVNKLFQSTTTASILRRMVIISNTLFCFCYTESCAADAVCIWGHIGPSPHLSGPASPEAAMQIFYSLTLMSRHQRDTTRRFQRTLKVGDLSSRSGRGHLTERLARTSMTLVRSRRKPPFPILSSTDR